MTSTPSPASTAANLPPSRKSKPMRTVSPPLSNTPVNKFIYILAILTTVLLSFYTYRLVQYKTEVGGWWNYAMGKKPLEQAYASASTGNGAGGEKSTEGRKPGEPSVEDRINDLAKALGMPTNELASAIAGAVKNYVPPASLSSVVAKETGPVIDALVQGGAEVTDSASSVMAESTGFAGAVVSGMEGFVGMDEP